MVEQARGSAAVRLLVVLVGAGLLAVLAAGCASTGDVSQFSPIPKARVGADSLDPVSPRPVTELLRDAEQAFNKANKAQEEGDQEAALRHYTLMLELLIEADLDPAIFYSLRQEFDAIIDNSSKQAQLYARTHPQATAGEFRPVGGYSEIRVPFPLPERVLEEIDEIQNRYPKSFQAGLNRSFQYRPYIVSEFEKAGLPPELMWIAMVESMFTPKIVSRAGAGGMWQFMRSTGRRYNLRQDHYVDERYDWKKATQAAISYLKDLHDFFDGSWPLAVTAYNMGEGGLERAIASNGGERNLWKLLETPPASLRIRLETKKYYPRFLAMLIVTSNPERYGFKVQPAPADNTARVRVEGMYALGDLDKAMGYSGGTLAKLNPELLREITPPTGHYDVTIPAGDSERFALALQKTPKMKTGGGAHRVRRGETVSQIAQRYGVSQRELMRVNKIASPRALQAGKNLIIPGEGRAVGGGGSSPSSNASASSTPVRGSGGKEYTVRSGDTLFEIAKAHSISVNDIQQWNELGRSSRIRPGDALVVSDPASTVALSTTGNKYHEVHAGEYPAKIARMHGIELEDLLRWNNLSKNSMIRVGDRLVINPNGAGTASAGSQGGGEEITHTVKRGDTASTIAQQYGVSTKQFLAWNNLSARSVLRIGQKFVVYPNSGGANSEAAQGEKIVHTVARGHNPTTIARRYGVRVSELFAWNNWQKNHVLQIGDKVVVYKD